MSVVRPLLVSSRGVLETIVQLVVERLNGNPIVTSGTIQARNLVAESPVRSNDIKVGSVDIGTITRIASGYICSHEPLYLGDATLRNSGCTGSRVLFGDDPNPTDGSPSVVWPRYGALDFQPTAFDEQQLGMGVPSPFTSNALTIPATGVYRIHVCVRGDTVTTVGANTAMTVQIGAASDATRAWTVASRPHTTLQSTSFTYNLNIVHHCTINETVKVRAHCPRTTFTGNISGFMRIRLFDFSIERIGDEFTSAG